jgi:hypothetical protein
MIHVLNTWALANLLHGVVLRLYFGSMSGEFFPDDTVGFYCIAIFFSFLFSLPALLLAFLAFIGVKRMPATVNTLFLCWLSAAAFIPLLFNCLMMLLFGIWPSAHEDNFIMVSGSIAAAASVMIRSPFFFRYFARLPAQEQQSSITINENK